jgi:DNA-binding response OmpR family regulator
MSEMTQLARNELEFLKAAPAAKLDPVAVRRVAAPRVLVIDGDSDRRDLLTDVVTRSGGRPEIAATGAETIELLAAQAPECLLVASLPDGTARAFIGWARPRYPAVAIVAIADGVQESTELYHAGADLVAPMPLDADLLGAKLAAAMRSAQRNHLRLVS